MRVRALDADHDWTFGKGQNDYKANLDAVVQSINTRLNSFLGDCFFSASSGIDWFNLLGSKNALALNLAISATILNTEGVVALHQLSLNLDDARELTVRYKVLTVYSTSSQEFEFDLNGSI